MASFDHVIHVDGSTRELVIYRLFADGRRTLYTSVKLPSLQADASTPVQDRLREFATQLGENLLMDSPDARRLLGL
jgi:hypothetical protein